MVVVNGDGVDWISCGVVMQYPDMKKVVDDVELNAVFVLTSCYG